MLIQITDTVYDFQTCLKSSNKRNLKKIPDFCSNGLLQILHNDQ